MLSALFFAIFITFVKKQTPIDKRIFSYYYIN